MRDKNQIGMWSTAELSLIKNTFADNENLLYLIRKVFFQFPLTDSEKEEIRTKVNESVYGLIKKRLFQELNPEAVMTEIGDFYITLNQDLRSKSVDDMKPLMLAKELERKYLEQCFNDLLGLMEPQNVGTVTFDPHIYFEKLARIDPDNLDASYVNLMARNFILGYIVSGLNSIKIMAGAKEETEEDMLKRLKLDSSK